MYLRINLIVSLMLLVIGAAERSYSQQSLLLKDVKLGTASSYAREFQELDGALYFVAIGNSGGIEFWRTDGSSSGTLFVKNLVPNAGIGTLQGGYYYFLQNPQWISRLGESLIVKGGSSSGYSLWRSDGTSGGTTLIRNFSYELGDQLGFVKLGSNIFFNADDGTHGNELWKTDGTTAGTAMVKDLNPNPDQNLGNSWMQSLTALDSRVLFYASDINGHNGLWSSDGTSTGTIFLAEMSSYIQIERVGSRAFIIASNGTQSGLWASDGSAAGTKFLKQFGDSGSGYPEIVLSHLGDQAILAVIDQDVAIWRSDGTEAGSYEIGSFENNNNLQDSIRFADVGGALYFALRSSLPLQSTLYRTDGTAAGTRSADYLSGNYAFAYAFQNQLILKICQYTLVDCNLWRSDGEFYGATLIEGLDDATKAAFESSTQLGDRFIFAFNDPTRGEEPWVMSPPDNCPDDPQKLEPGICGCGVADSDADGDGVLNCYEQCPNDAEKTAEGICGCGIRDIDESANGVMDCRDPSLDLAPPAPKVSVKGRTVTVSMPSYQNVQYQITINHTVKKKPSKTKVSAGSGKKKQKKKIKIYNYTSSASTVQFPGMTKGKGSVIYSIVTGPAHQTPPSNAAKYKVGAKKKKKNH